MTDLFGFTIPTMFVWIGIVICIVHSAIFSGLNLACFSLNRLQLEVAATEGDSKAVEVLAMRQDSNFLLTTILWGNVGINVLLTLLSDSILAGASAFVFSTAFITLFGEITPQAYFSRHALSMASLLAPLLRFYQIVLYPVAKPCALLLDVWLGVEGIDYMRERDLQAVIKKHIDADHAELQAIEGRGALNFLQIDDLLVSDAGQVIDPASVISLPTNLDFPLIPAFEKIQTDEFLTKVNQSGHKWVVLTDEGGVPYLVLDADGFLRAAMFSSNEDIKPYDYCHRPIIISNPNTLMGSVVGELRTGKVLSSSSVIDKDIVLIWADTDRRIITGADILGRLLKGIEPEA